MKNVFSLAVGCGTMTAMPSITELVDLTGQVAIVTGGSRGIGREIVQMFAENGADVVIASRKFENCVTAAEEVTASTGRRALPVAFHAGKWDDCERLYETVLQEFGRIDVLVNNAGMSPLYESVASITEDLYDKTLSVNLKGPFRLSALAGTWMYEHDGGAIVNISTSGSLMASTNELPYACAKAGLNAMTAGLAHTFAPKVRVNCILPGPFDTDIAKAWPPEMHAAAKHFPLQRLGRADEVAPMALLLATRASSYTTGAIIRVDGGITRHV